MDIARVATIGAELLDDLTTDYEAQTYRDAIRELLDALKAAQEEIILLRDTVTMAKARDRAIQELIESRDLLTNQITDLTAQLDWVTTRFEQALARTPIKDATECIQGSRMLLARRSPNEETAEEKK